MKNRSMNEKKRVVLVMNNSLFKDELVKDYQSNKKAKKNSQSYTGKKIKGNQKIIASKVVKAKN